jgi:non-ribosomal peptide synthetase component F
MREVTSNAFANQDVPFDRIVEEVQPNRATGGNPLVQVMFVLQRGIPQSTLEASGLRITPMWDMNNGAARFDLEVHLWEVEEGILASFIYNTDLFEASTISGIADCWRTFLEGIVSNPDSALSELPLLREEEQRALRAAATASSLNARVEDLSDEEVEALLSGMLVGGAEDDE